VVGSNENEVSPVGAELALRALPPLSTVAVAAARESGSI
jgi:hypothetical protein